KWSKGKQSEEANNMVLFDQASYDKFLSEAPKYKLITQSILSDRLREHQEEVNKLSEKTSGEIKMNAIMQPGGPSPKENGMSSTLKTGPSNVQNGSFPSQVKGKKREHSSNHNTDPLDRNDATKKGIDLDLWHKEVVGVITSTDQDDCLNQFVHLRGLPIVDDWLKDVHKGKTGDIDSPKESDKVAEELPLTLLHALGKLLVDIDALKTCNVGKSMNQL
ncbi:hypothetical protein KI387_002655, partial [Taxus chinensis]